ncbi:MULTISPECIES: lectin-like protein, partial [unclassified Ruegeria]|uniref:lectin-like protein n=1 Tax=unclassified Ruegeria TaxID=2625375 RepID=UPI002739326F
NGLSQTGYLNENTYEMLLSLASRQRTTGSVDSGTNATESIIAKTSPDSRLSRVRRVFPGKDLVVGNFDGRLYVVVLTWSSHSLAEARALARRSGGTLASITSAAEYDFVMKLAQSDSRLWTSDDPEHRHGPSIGLYQSKGAREPSGGWVWDSGESYTLNRWTRSEPNNHDGGEDVAALWIKNGGGGRTVGWNDTKGISRSFIIEIP